MAVCAHVCRLVLMYAFVCVFKPKDDLGYHFIDGICPSFISAAMIKQSYKKQFGEENGYFTLFFQSESRTGGLKVEA